MSLIGICAVVIAVVFCLVFAADFVLLLRDRPIDVGAAFIAGALLFAALGLAVMIVALDARVAACGVGASPS